MFGHSDEATGRQLPVPLLLQDVTLFEALTAGAIGRIGRQLETTNA